MTDLDARVCPRCGDEAEQSEYCGTCGLHLFAQSELPTRKEWEASRHGQAPGQASLGRASSAPSPDWLRRTARAYTPRRALLAGLVSLAVIALVVAVLVGGEDKSGDDEILSQVDKTCEGASTAEREQRDADFSDFGEFRQQAANTASAYAEAREALQDLDPPANRRNDIEELTEIFDDQENLLRQVAGSGSLVEAARVSPGEAEQLAERRDEVASSLDRPACRPALAEESR